MSSVATGSARRPNRIDWGAVSGFFGRFRQRKAGRNRQDGAAVDYRLGDGWDHVQPRLSKKIVQATIALETFEQPSPRLMEWLVKGRDNDVSPFIVQHADTSVGPFGNTVVLLAATTALLPEAADNWPARRITQLMLTQFEQVPNMKVFDECSISIVVQFSNRDPVGSWFVPEQGEDPLVEIVRGDTPGAS